MENINENFKRFNELLISITENASPKQKKYANELLTELYLKRGDLEYEYKKMLTKLVDILRILGLSKVNYLSLSDEFINFMFENAIDLNKQITVNELLKLKNLYNLHVQLFNTYPDKLKDLKKVKEEYA